MNGSSRNIDIGDWLGIAGVCAFIAFMASLFAAWLTHVVVCLSAGKWGLLIAGLFSRPSEPSTDTESGSDSSD